MTTHLSTIDDLSIYDTDIINAITNSNSTNGINFNNPADLFFYYSASSNLYSDQTTTENTAQIYQDYSLFSDSALQNKTGQLGVFKIIFDINNKLGSVSNNNYDASFQFTIFTSDGTISCLQADKVINENNTYLLANGTYTYNISSGTGNYLNKKGAIVLNVSSLSTRTVAVYFEN